MTRTLWLIWHHRLEDSLVLNALHGVNSTSLPRHLSSACERPFLKWDTWSCHRAVIPTSLLLSGAWQLNNTPCQITYTHPQENRSTSHPDVHSSRCVWLCVHQSAADFTTCLMLRLSLRSPVLFLDSNIDATYPTAGAAWKNKNIPSLSLFLARYSADYSFLKSFVGQASLSVR